MKKSETKFLNSVLAIGMFLVFAGFLIFAGFAGKYASFSFLILPLVFFISGLVFLYIYMAFSRTAFKLFCGLEFTFFGIFSIFIINKIFPFSMAEGWPVCILITAISLFFSGISSSRKPALYYAFPAIFLLLLGIVMLLFSFDIIKISLGQLMLFIGPIIIVLCGIFLILLFLHRKTILEMLPESLCDEIKKEQIFEESSDE